MALHSVIFPKSLWDTIRVFFFQKIQFIKGGTWATHPGGCYNLVFHYDTLKYFPFLLICHRDTYYTYFEKWKDNEEFATRIWTGDFETELSLTTLKIPMVRIRHRFHATKKYFQVYSIRTSIEAKNEKHHQPFSITLYEDPEDLPDIYDADWFDYQFAHYLQEHIFLAILPIPGCSNGSSQKYSGGSLENFLIIEK